MPVDRWGLKFLYPTKKTAGITNAGTGFFWEQSDDIEKDSYFSGEGHVTNSSGGQFTMSTSGPDAVQIAKNDCCAQTEIGGCSMDFAKSAQRGYSYKADDPRDIELTILVKYVSSGSDNGFAIEGPTGGHSSSGCCSGNCYKADIQYRPSTPLFRFRKEMWHVDNTDDPTTGASNTHAKFNFQLLGHSTFVGFKWVRYNVPNGALAGHNTTDSVKLELWGNIHPDTDPTDWFKVLETEDKGGWGSSGGQCNGDKDQIGSFSAPKFRLKSNDSSGEFQFKHISLREIDPFASFDDTPQTPDPGEEPTGTQTISLKYKLQWDINTSRVQSLCAGAGGGGGGGSGATSFYDVAAVNDKELSNSSTFQNRTGVVEQLTSSGGIMSGKKLIQLDVPLKKAGTPGASPTVGAKIISSSGADIYVSPTTFDPSTFSTSFVYKTFDFSANTHTFVTGDCVGVFYTGTSSSNYVICGYTDGDTVTNCGYCNFESGALDAKTREFACRMWE